MPELIKRMYDYRMAIENMRAEVTVAMPVHTVRPHRTEIKRHFFFAYDRGRVRCDETLSNSETSHVRLYQHLSTPDFYFLRHPSIKTPESGGVFNTSEINDGNSLTLNLPFEQPFNTLDPRRIGTDVNGFDIMETKSFNYDTLLDDFYNPLGENYNVSVDYVDGEKLYKVSYQVSRAGISGSHWFNPQKGFNLVQSKVESEMRGLYIDYSVILGMFDSDKGSVWFPQKIFHRHRVKNNVSEEETVVDSIEFDVQDETPFTPAGLGIPVGYQVAAFGEIKYWDGKELVDNIPYVFKPVNLHSRKVFWIVNGIGFALIAIFILMKWIQMLLRRSN